MTADELRESLLMNPKNGLTLLSAQEREEMERYCLRYREFIDACKTEREATAWAVKKAEALGYKPFQPVCLKGVGQLVHRIDSGRK